jgi:hypothetical protein
MRVSDVRKQVTAAKPRYRDAHGVGHRYREISSD